MPATEWLSPKSTGTHSGSGAPQLGTGIWYNNLAIKLADGASAFIGPPGTNLVNGEYTEWLVADNFAPALPSDAIVIGIAFRINARRPRGSANIVNVVLRDAGNFPPATLKKPNTALGGGYQTFTYGGERDRWGYNLTRALVNGSGFGVAVQCRATSAGTNIDVDYLQAKIWYTQTATVTPNPSRDYDSTPACSALLGSITLNPEASHDADYMASRSAALLGSIQIQSVTNYDLDLTPEPIGVALSDYFIIPSLGTSYDLDISEEPSDTLYGSISLLPAACFDTDYTEPITGSFLYGSLTLAPAASYDLDYSPIGLARYATIIQSVPAGFDYERVYIEKPVQVIWSVLVLHPDFVRNSQQSQVQAFPLLVTITHKDLPAPLRFTDAGQSLVSRGEAYLALPISISLPTSGRNERAEGSIVLPIQSRQVRGIFRTLTGKPASVRIEMVRGSDPDIVEDTWSMRLAATETGQNVVLGLNDGDFEDRQFPPLIFDGRWQAVHD